MKLPLYIISDCHFRMSLDSYEKERRQRLFSFFEHVEQTGGTLILGGDIFDFWFDYKYVVPRDYLDILQKLSSINQSGIDIHYIAGNHDFWDFGYFKEKFGANVYSKNLEFTQNNIQIQVCHGDGLLKNDHGYRLMKKIIRSSFCIWLFKLFHPDWGCALAKKVSKASGDYHHHDLKANTIRTELIDYARSQWKLGYNIVLLGHYHQTGIVEENENTVIFMGDWLRHFTVTRLDENGWWQGKWCDI